jgi:hypothetical protein
MPFPEKLLPRNVNRITEKYVIYFPFSKNTSTFALTQAEVAELVDAHVSGACGSNPVRVRLSPSAQKPFQIKWKGFFVLIFSFSAYNNSPNLFYLALLRLLCISGNSAVLLEIYRHGRDYQAGLDIKKTSGVVKASQLGNDEYLPEKSGAVL